MVCSKDTYIEWAPFIMDTERPTEAPSALTEEEQYKAALAKSLATHASEEEAQSTPGCINFYSCCVRDFGSKHCMLPEEEYR